MNHAFIIAIIGITIPSKVMTAAEVERLSFYGFERMEPAEFNENVKKYTIYQKIGEKPSFNLLCNVPPAKMS